MKKAISFFTILIFATLFICSCKKQTATINGTYNIKLGAWVSLNKNVSICFDSLITDSRCPANAFCLWGGVAVAKFSYRQNNTVMPFTLATVPFNTFLTDTTINQIKILFQDITPRPVLNNPNKNDITAIIKIN